MVALKRTAILVLSAIFQYAVDQLYGLIFRLCMYFTAALQIKCMCIIKEKPTALSLTSQIITSFNYSNRWRT